MFPIRCIPFVLAASAIVAANAASAATWSANGAVSLAQNYSVMQNAGSVTITAERNGGTQGAISVSYTTVSETARAGVQFTAETGTIEWADGDGKNKTFTIPITSVKPYSGQKYLEVRITAGPSTLLGAHTGIYVYIVGDSSPVVTTSIKKWVTCDETIDESTQLQVALEAAANNAFVLLIDCPVRFHTGAAAASSIAVPDGVTISFSGAGEFLIVSNGPPALTVAHPAMVSFFDWNVTFL